MSRSRACSTGVLATACLLATGCESPKAPAADHLLLVTLDTTRADRLGCYGRPDAGTPTLDGLAETGTRFARAYCQVPLTLPSHVSILTGLRPPRTGVHVNEQTAMDPAVQTLAQRLAAEGFFTAAAIGGYPLSRRFPVSRGFEAFDDTMADPRNPAGLERDAGKVVEAAVGLLAGRAARRTFLWVHFFDPHDPYEPPEPFRTRYAGDPYQGEIARTDAALAELLRQLDRELGAERLLVCVVGDHGEALGDHGEPTHGFFIYDSTMRVPMILRGPAVPRGHVVDAPAATVDLVPTLLDLLGLPVPDGLDGVVREMRDEHDVPERPVYLESELPRRHYGWSALYGAVRGWRKYVAAPRPELYDLRDDPGELRNLVDDRTRDATELDAWLAEVRQQGEAGGKARVRPDPRLVSLGYVGAGGAAGSDPAADPKDRLRTYVDFQNAGRLLEEGRPAPALELLDALVARDDRPGARFKRAQALRMLGRLDEAEAELIGLEARAPYPGVDLEITRIALWTERPKLALDRIERHLAEHPTDAEARMLRGAAREMLGEVAGAEQDYRKALELNPLFRGASLRLGALLVVAGRLDEARQQLRAHLARYPDDDLAKGLLDSIADTDG